jgi:6-phosphogluconate dehydrogenase
MAVKHRPCRPRLPLLGMLVAVEHSSEQTPTLTPTADIGVIGLAVMGENLILNMASKGFTVACFNRTVQKVRDFVAGRAAGHSIIGGEDLGHFVAQLKRPRRIMLMVKAGAAVDDTIAQLLPHLAPGDIVIDGGNSYFEDSSRRVAALAEHGLLFIGAGVSGGEEGALHGPSIMPGGAAEAWPAIKPIFQGIAAKVADESPCCEWVGPAGAGHFVKMVHNGIEYGDMQMIAEAYSLLRSAGLGNGQIAGIMRDWNSGELESYLIEISSEILEKKDEETGGDLVDVILDSAGQKGTGKWTSTVALDVGSPANTIAESVFARCLSALKDERVRASGVLAGPPAVAIADQAAFVEDVRQALFASKICSYAQGFQLMRLVAEEQHWPLHYGEIALMWRAGCIIRAGFLDDIKAAFANDPALPNLLLAPHFAAIMASHQAAWRRVVAHGTLAGVWMPTFASALAYFDGYRSAQLPLNLTQAQRDYFGAHTYERTDKPRGVFFHTNWTGRGGNTSSSTYSV